MCNVPLLPILWLQWSPCCHENVWHIGGNPISSQERSRKSKDFGKSSENIQGNGVYEAEATRIYSAARQNAFIITLLFMAFTAFVAFLMARNLPAKQAVTEDEEA